MFYKIIKLNSKDLPRIGDVTKELINLGFWYLYSLKKNKKYSANYLLKIEENIFFLGINGEILKKEEAKEFPVFEKELDGIVYFKDLPEPEIKVRQTSNGTF